MQDVGPLLAIDTSGATASVAIYHDRVLAEAVWQSGRGHSSQLLPTIEVMLNLARLDRREIAVLAVAAGPGSYAGLRVGISTAMGLAVALGIGITQVPTLDVIAWGQLIPESTQAQRQIRAAPRIRAAIEIGRGHYATARFTRGVQKVEQESGIENVSLSELLELASVEHAVLAVDLDREAREQVDRDYGARIEMVPPSAAARRAGFLAELAVHGIRRGEPVTGSVEAIYLH